MPNYVKLLRHYLLLTSDTTQPAEMGLNLLLCFTGKEIYTKSVQPFKITSYRTRVYISSSVLCPGNLYCFIKY